MTRLVSLLLGASLALALLFIPAARGRALTATEHGLMTLLLLAICALFVHGSGLRMQTRALRWLFSPWLLWPLTGLLAAAFWRQAAG